jgi:hypothetical protein
MEDDGAKVRQVADALADSLGITTTEFLSQADAAIAASNALDETGDSAANTENKVRSLTDAIRDNIAALASVSARSLALEALALEDLAAAQLSGGGLSGGALDDLFRGTAELQSDAAAAGAQKIRLEGLEGVFSTFFEGVEDDAEDAAGGVGSIADSLESLKALLEGRDLARFAGAFAELLGSVDSASARNLRRITGGIDLAALNTGEWGELLEIVGNLMPTIEDDITRIGAAFELPGFEDAASNTASMASSVSGAASASEDLLSNLRQISFDRSLRNILLTPFQATRFGGITPLQSGVESFGGGAALLGEQGPELAVLPRGTSVLDADRTASIMSAGPGGITIENVNIETVTDLDDFMAQVDRAARAAGV